MAAMFVFRCPFITPSLLCLDTKVIYSYLWAPILLLDFCHSLPMSQCDDFTPLCEAHQSQSKDLGMKIRVQTPPYACEALYSGSVHQVSEAPHSGSGFLSVSHTVLTRISSVWLSLCSGLAKLLLLPALVFPAFSSAGFSADGWLYLFFLDETFLAPPRGQGSWSFRLLNIIFVSFTAQ